MASAPVPASRRIRAAQNYSVDPGVDSYWRDFRERRLVTNNYFAYHRAGLTVSQASRAPWDRVNEQPSLRLVDEGTKHLPQNWDEIYADLDITALQTAQRRNRLRVGRERGPPDPQQHVINRQCIPIPTQASPEFEGSATVEHKICRRQETDSEYFSGQSATTLRRLLRSMGCNVRLLRVLGEGSGGVAALFDIYDEARGTRKKFVVKGAIPPGTLTNEKGVHDVCPLGHYLRVAIADIGARFSDSYMISSSCYEHSTSFAGTVCAESCCHQRLRQALRG